MTKEKIGAILDDRIEELTQRALAYCWMIDIEYAEKKHWEPMIRYAESQRRLLTALKTDLPHLTEEEAVIRLNRILGDVQCR